MDFINNLGIFVLCALSLVGHMEARSVSYSNIGDIRIEHTDDKWLCDKILCPIEDTVLCYVSKSNEQNPSVLVRTNICYSQDNTPLASDITSTNIDPNSNIRLVVNSYSNGMITTSNSVSNINTSNASFNSEKFNQDLQNQLQDTNDKIQENLQNQMNQLQETLSNMQNNLAHMFD